MWSAAWGPLGGECDKDLVPGEGPSIGGGAAVLRTLFKDRKSPSCLTGAFAPTSALNSYLEMGLSPPLYPGSARLPWYIYTPSGSLPAEPFLLCTMENLLLTLASERRGGSYPGSWERVETLSGDLRSSYQLLAPRAARPRLDAVPTVADFVLGAFLGHSWGDKQAE